MGRLLKAEGYSLQGNRKTKEGKSHPDRNAQLEHIDRTVKEFQRRGQPVISVDTKKKELVGEYANGEREWRAKGDPEEVLVHDYFMDKDLGKAIPYGVYELLTANQGWVSVGGSITTRRASPRRPSPPVVDEDGIEASSGCRGELLVTADGGGVATVAANSSVGKVALRDLADQLGMPIQVCHFPPGTSKWNKIEHRMFCHITQNWRGRPLVSHEVIVNLIASTATEQGLSIQAELDSGRASRLASRSATQS